jgi:hypothetical protein
VSKKLTRVAADGGNVAKYLWEICVEVVEAKFSWGIAIVIIMPRYNRICAALCKVLWKW